MAYNAAYTVNVRAPLQKVFDYVADVSRHGEWGSADDQMKATAEKPGPPAVGTRYKAQGKLNGKLNQSTVTITRLEAPNRLAFDAEDANSVFHHEFVFSSSDGGTRVDRNVTMTKGPFYFPIVLAVFKGTVQKNYNGAMSNLKAKMESGG
jgi:uncharacterized protein YndB with AHSA1/START domain